MEMVPWGTTLTTIDAAGRVVIPKQIREQLGLAGGGPVTIEEHDGVVEIRPARVEVDLVRRGSVTVLRPRAELAAVDEDDVRATLEHLRAE